MVCFINKNGMDFDATIDIIIKDLREISEIVDDFKKYRDVPQLQIELAKSKCRSAAEIITLLKTYRPDMADEPVDKQISVKSKEPEAGSLSGIPEDVPQAEHTVHANEPPPLPIPENKKEEVIIPPVRSRTRSALSDAIGLNNKFLFISRIFGGNAKAYEEAIAKLSKAENLPDAKAIIMSYTGEAEETEEVSQLLEIVERKLPSNG
jgi:hypothetical protein